MVENFTDKDVKDFADKLFDTANKATAGHMVEPENVDEEKAKSFDNWVKKTRKMLIRRTDKNFLRMCGGKINFKYLYIK